MALPRGRGAGALASDEAVSAVAGGVEPELSAAVRLLEPGATVTGRLAAVETRAAATDMVTVPIMKGPWSQATVSEVPLSADHWVARAFAGSKDSVVEVLQNGERQGTGFFADRAGLAVTNHHVVGVPTLSYELGLSDGSRVAARVVSIDPQADLAVLKVAPGGAGEYPALKIGSSAARATDEVVALGFPEDARAVTASPGSYLGHEAQISPAGVQKNVGFDMVMKRGNSGSPVLDREGRVIAVLNRYTFGDQAYGPAGEHVNALLEATRSTNIGNKYLVISTGVRKESPS